MTYEPIASVLANYKESLGSLLWRSVRKTLSLHIFVLVNELLAVNSNSTDHIPQRFKDSGSNMALLHLLFFFPPLLISLKDFFLFDAVIILINTVIII